MKKWLLAAFAALVFCGQQSWATPVSPSFAGAPAGWVVDRYAPDSFTDVGTFQGRTDVLGIGIGSAGNSINRAATGRQGSFYNTQGMSHTVTGGVGDSLSASLYIPGSWADPGQGARRTDMWGVVTDGTATITGYPISGFTNKGGDGFVGFRTWEVLTGVWHNLASAPVHYDAWNDLEILFTGSTFEYRINGLVADIVAADPTTKNFSSEIMQAFNFADPALGHGYVVNAYTAHWSDTPPETVPEPSSFALLGVGLIGLSAIRRKKMVS